MTARILFHRVSVASEKCLTFSSPHITDGLSIWDRIMAGDVEAVVDAIAEASEQLDEAQIRLAATMDLPTGVAKRLSEVRRRQQQTGRQWRGASFPKQEPAATDRSGKEPGGAGR